MFGKAIRSTLLTLALLALGLAALMAVIAASHIIPPTSPFH